VEEGREEKRIHKRVKERRYRTFSPLCRKEREKNRGRNSQK